MSDSEQLARMLRGHLDQVDFGPEGREGETTNDVYLSKRSVEINVLCFEVFEYGGEKLLSRAWLLDPVESQMASSGNASKSSLGPWNGEYYVSFGGRGRSWDEAAKYGFECRRRRMVFKYPKAAQAR